ncbi:MAG TPA: PKD domain-containing protein, partial [Planctomycetes bacterium]|nr:PKD domain-containing protein [Planctomycetota bacterium]
MGGMGLIALAAGKSTAPWAQNYYDMTLAMINHSLDTHFDSQGFYNESQGYLATGWFNLLHTVTALKITGDADFFQDERFIRWNKCLAQTCTPGGTIIQFEDSSLTGGYMMMTASVPMAAALAPPAHNASRSWMKFAYLATIQNHPYLTPYNGEAAKYTYTSLYPDMLVCGVAASSWNDVAAAAPPNSFLPEKSPAGGRGHYVWRTGMQPSKDIQVVMNSRWKCGWPASTHEHMDGGGMELFAYGARLLVSPGYSDSGGPIADWQDATLAVSTVIADRNGNGVFDIVADRQDGGDGWSDNNGPAERAVADAIGLASAKYDFWYNSDPAFTRNLFFIGKSPGAPPYVVVIDDVDMATPSRMVGLTWHCRGNANVSGQTAEWVVAADNNGPDVTLNVCVVKPEGLSISSDVGSYYPMYGSAGTGWEDYVTYMIAADSGKASYRFVSVLYPRRDGQEMPLVTGIAGSNACSVGSDDIFFTQDEPFDSITVENVTTNAEMAFVRKAGPGNIDGFAAKKGASLDYGGAGFVSSAPVTIALLNFSGAVETYSDTVSITLNDPDITLPVTVKVDGGDVPSTASAGSVTFTVAAAGHHALEIVVGNNPPQAAISTSPSPARGAAPLLVQFDGSASTDPDGFIVAYEWDFTYDGVVFNVQAAGAATSHSYAVPGDYTAALRVVDDGGASNIATVPVQALAGNSPPTASVDASPTEGPAPLNVAFDAGMSSDPDGDALTFQWDFDYDGVSFDVGADTGASSVTTHEYPLPGVFTAAVRVDDGNGHTDIDTVIVTVSGVDVTAPSVNVSSAVLGGTVTDDSTAPEFVLLNGTAVPVDAGEWVSGVIPLVGGVNLIT